METKVLQVSAKRISIVTHQRGVLPADIFNRKMERVWIATFGKTKKTIMQNFSKEVLEIKKMVKFDNLAVFAKIEDLEYRIHSL